MFPQKRLKKQFQPFNPTRVDRVSGTSQRGAVKQVKQGNFNEWIASGQERTGENSKVNFWIPPTSDKYSNYIILKED
jgi:hypothetical protein